MELKSLTFTAGLTEKIGKVKEIDFTVSNGRCFFLFILPPAFWVK
jgi:hypothetical protein